MSGLQMLLQANVAPNQLRWPEPCSIPKRTCKDITFERENLEFIEFNSRELLRSRLSLKSNKTYSRIHHSCLFLWQWFPQANVIPQPWNKQDPCSSPNLFSNVEAYSSDRGSSKLILFLNPEVRHRAREDLCIEDCQASTWGWERLGSQTYPFCKMCHKFQEEVIRYVWKRWDLLLGRSQFMQCLPEAIQCKHLLMWFCTDATIL